MSALSGKKFEQDYVQCGGACVLFWWLGVVAISTEIHILFH
jgi:hypothetical protein